MDPDQFEERMGKLLSSQPGGTLVTLDDDGFPYPTYVLFAATAKPDIIFASFRIMKHATNGLARAQAGFLVDARDYVKIDPNLFDRFVAQGLLEMPARGTAAFDDALGALKEGNPESAKYVEMGADVWVLHVTRFKFSPGLQREVYQREFAAD
jgi:hypothetical protein